MFAPSGKPGHATVTVILVGDDPGGLKRTENLLRGKNAGPANFEVAAKIPIKKVPRALEHPGREIDALVLDLPFCGNGLEVFNTVKSVARRLPVIVISELSDHGLALELIKSGAQDFLLRDSLTEDLLARSILYGIERNAIERDVIKLVTALKTKDAELKRVQMQLIQAEKMESLGRMAAGVAHEVKNPLGMLQMGLDFYRQRRDPDDGVSELMLRRMGEAIERADRIIRDMVDFSRSTELEQHPDDLNMVLRKALTLTHHTLTRSKITVVSEFTEPLPAVKIDRMKIEQVMVNLITNAVQSMPDGGELEVKTYSGEIEQIVRDEGLRSLEQLRAGDRVVVAEIRDYGTGIPRETLSKIFDPFFTTKATGKGAGLGLAVANTIVNLHRGMIRIKNMKPRGVRVRVILRAYDPENPGETTIFISEKD